MREVPAAARLVRGDCAREAPRLSRPGVLGAKPVPGFGDRARACWWWAWRRLRAGGNRTGRVFTGDSSGDWLYAALHANGFASQSESVGADDGLTLS